MIDDCKPAHFLTNSLSARVYKFIACKLHNSLFVSFPKNCVNVTELPFNMSVQYVVKSRVLPLSFELVNFLWLNETSKKNRPLFKQIIARYAMKFHANFHRKITGTKNEIRAFHLHYFCTVLSTKSFEIGIKNNKDPLEQLQNTRKAIEYHIVSILPSMKGLKFVETLKVTFKKLANDNIVYKTTYFNSKAQTIINNIEIPEALQLSKQQILNMIAKWISEGSGWTIQSVDNHHLSIVKYQPMKGSSYIKLPQELRNGKKGLINMKNEDNECFRWCHIRHLNPQGKHPERI